MDNKDVDDIFNAMGKLSSIIHLEDLRSKKIDQIYSAKAKRCGNCAKWMTKSCEKEQKTKRIMSCNDSCYDCHWVDKGGLLKKFTQELEEIDNRLQEVMKNAKLTTVNKTV